MIMKRSKLSLAFLIFSSVVTGAGADGLATEADPSAAQPAAAAPPAAGPPPPAEALPAASQPSSEAFTQIVAPIALYPDGLVAQILAAATYPVEIVEADRWLQQGGSGLDEAAFGEAVDQQAWDPSVKALTQFPSILANLDNNLSWTTALGQAYVSQPQAVFAAIQMLRSRSEQAGTLKSTPQETVTNEGQTIDIDPASPDFVYLPEYDPWLAYGTPVDAYPDWNPYPGLYLDGPGNWFDLGVGIGVFGGFAWGWHHWRTDWHAGRLVYNHAPYFAHGPAFVGGHDPHRGRGGFEYSGGFRAITPPRVGPDFRADGLGSFARAGVVRPYAFSGRIGGGVPAGGFHADGGFHAGEFHGSGGHGGEFHGAAGGAHR
jgi:hypothetical protein